MTIDLSRCRIPPEGVPPYPHAHFSHQVAGIEALVKWNDTATGRTSAGCFLLADETGAGKTKQVIDAAQVLFTQKQIKRVVVIAPGAVRSVWFDKELGELAKHLWLDLPCTVTEYHSRTRQWLWATEGNDAPRLSWCITNYEFLRSEVRLAELLNICDNATLLVCDESAMVKNWQALQTKAVRKIRRKVGRIILLNGTPIADKPFDLFSQANLMSPTIIYCTSMTAFKARYAVMGGYMVQTKWGKMPTQVLRWQNLDELQRLMAPYVLRRLKEDCIDLPPKLEPVVLTATLTPTTWAHYKAMRDDMVSWLSASTLSTAQQTIVKIIRLSQITSGFLGGVEVIEDMTDDRPWNMGDDGARLDYTGLDITTHADPAPVIHDAVREVGREKLDVFLEWLVGALEEDPNLKLLVMCRFRAELARVVLELQGRYPNMEVGSICGGQKRSERQYALRLMDPRTTPQGPATVVMTSAGNVGLTLTAAHTVFRMSRDTSLYKWLQGDDRVHRPTQTHAVSYIDLVAEGPRGQKTIDKDILVALLNKRDIADWTTSAWVERLVSEV